MRSARWFVLGLVPLALLGGAWLLYGPREPITPPPDPAPPGLFVDVAASAGVGFRHFDPATPQRTIAETIGSGVGWIDYDADGWIDLFCVQDCPLRNAADPRQGWTHRLYRNLGAGRFEDVTERVGLGRSGFGTGCAVGDYDNDGFDDLCVVYFGRVELWRNVPDGAGGRRFEDVTAAAKLAGANPHWGTSAAWGDLDADGRLDLYVCNYVEIDPAAYPACENAAKKLAIVCAPTMFPAVAHKLFRNGGDGTFRDVSREAGLHAPPSGPGLGVVLADLDGDGRLDVYAANDMKPAHLYHNRTAARGGIVLAETAGIAGAAYGPNGSMLSGMCAEAADVDGSGRPSLFVTNFQDRPNVLFRTRGGLRFTEDSGASGLGLPSRSRLGFGAAFLDVDLDGHQDLAVANGHVQPQAQELLGVPYPQAAQLFLGDGAGRFRDASGEAGADFVRPRVGRGLTRGDFDNDGRPDLAMSGVGEPLALLRNAAATANGWVGLELVGDGAASNRSAVGAIVTVEAGGRRWTHFVVGGGSYLSASDRRLAVGLGAGPTVADRVTVRWPSGRTQEFRRLPAGRYWRLREGVEAADARPTANL